MKLTSFIVFAPAALAAATPGAAPQSGTSKPLRFSGMSIRPASPIDSGSINANGGEFWIGKPTKTNCPKDTPAVADACKHANNKQTIFDYLNAQPTLSLDVGVPGGQQVYVNKDTGRLRFTTAHSAHQDGTPEAKGFSIVHDAKFQFEKKDWIACPEGPKGTYSVYAAAYKKADKKCLGFTWNVIKLDDKVPSAWQYN
ncbi:Ecp32-1 [Fulvia fulva]|uniref:Ecp32-1 n=1 Tax=Passalora fulva TaxID=5499 RepID=A0A1P8YXK2_PASFU|nr:Ecp32-1 [Fulvia fulva]AQA29233.1 extracellular protein 32-1 [Fulvia fulva]KAK4629305.1 Ecp32-1 [Fulvia fulva]KAK4630678.1 Ecp32-1 [Fulvia fulva]UJO15491.1 Ecp32-1 [Fulvia fulva]WPV12211.1 Ecp32-1 [Fulvia fulva]